MAKDKGGEDRGVAEAVLPGNRGTRPWESTATGTVLGATGRGGGDVRARRGRVAERRGESLFVAAGKVLVPASGEVGSWSCYDIFVFQVSL